MNEYEKDILINELQKMIVDKSMALILKDHEISNLKKEVERLEAQAKTNKENK